MSKNKKKKPQADVPPILRKYPMPKNLIWKLANDIHGKNADAETIYNTLKDFYCDTYTKAYLRAMDDANRFRMAREAIIKELFDAVSERVDDTIKGGVLINKDK
jgi:hypothetical protein